MLAQTWFLWVPYFWSNDGNFSDKIVYQQIWFSVIQLKASSFKWNSKIYRLHLWKYKKEWKKMVFHYCTQIRIKWGESVSLKLAKNKSNPNHLSQRKKNKGAKHTYFLLRCQIPAGFQIHSLTVSIQRITETMSEIPSPMDCSYTFKCGAHLTIWTLKSFYTLDLSFYTSEALDDAAKCVIISAPQRLQSTNAESFLL